MIDGPSSGTTLQLADWRRRVSQLYADVRTETTPEVAHARWRKRRDELFTRHPQSPLAPESPLRGSGLPYWPYDPALRFTLALTKTDEAAWLTVATGVDERIRMRRLGSVALPAPLGESVDVFWLEQYGGGLFLPLRDGTAGAGSYGGGRYLLDGAKGADLGGCRGRLVIDLNFLYHPSCRYDDAWLCPLAPAGNRIVASVRAGERL